MDASVEGSLGRGVRQLRGEAVERRLVVVGGGMAAQHFANRLVDIGAHKGLEITLLCAESRAPYDRVHLGSILGGDEPTSLALRDPDWYAENGIRLRLRERVERIDRTSRTVHTAAGSAFAYDRLVIATGGRAFVPPIQGVDLPGVVTYRNIDDALLIAKQVRAGKRVVVAGGGLLGIEAARAIAKLGCPVEIIERAPRLLPRQLDEDGARVLQDQIAALGVGLRIHERIGEIRRHATGLEVTVVDAPSSFADLVIVTTGIRPRDEIARRALLRCDRNGGILVDDAMGTSDPYIHAIGECARHRGSLYGFVAPCHAMADVLADRLAGGDRTFDGAVSSARLKVDEIPVAAVGDSLAEGFDVEALAWVTGDAYRRIVVREGRIVGGIAVGPGSDFPRLQEAVANGTRVREWHRRRFRKTGKIWREGTQKPLAEWPDRAVLCTCTGVTCGDLRRAYAEGHRTRPALMACTGAGGVCGSCRPLVAEIAGEATAGTRESAGPGVSIAATAGLALIGIAWAIGPIPMSTSVIHDASIDVLWRDSWWKQVSGFGLLALCAVSLVFSLRKRTGLLARGSVPSWRVLHSAIGTATIIAAGVHTGFRMGSNLNFALMVTFSGVVALGIISAFSVALERHLASTGSVLKRSLARAHIVAFSPMPVLVGFHVLAVYFY